MDDGSQDSNVPPASRPLLRPFSGQRQVEQGPLKLGGRRLARSPHLPPVVRATVEPPPSEPVAPASSASAHEVATTLAEDAAPNHAATAAVADVDTVELPPLHVNDAAGDDAAQLLDSAAPTSDLADTIVVIDASAQVPEIGSLALPDETETAAAEFHAAATAFDTQDSAVADTPADDVRVTESAVRGDDSMLPAHDAAVSDAPSDDFPPSRLESALDTSTLSRLDATEPKGFADFLADESLTYGGRRDATDLEGESPTLEAPAAAQGALDLGVEDRAVDSTATEFPVLSVEASEPDVALPDEDQLQLEASFDEVTAEWQVPTPESPATAATGVPESALSRDAELAPVAADDDAGRSVDGVGIAAFDAVESVSVGGVSVVVEDTRAVVEELEVAVTDEVELAAADDAADSVDVEYSVVDNDSRAGAVDATADVGRAAASGSAAEAGDSLTGGVSQEFVIDDSAYAVDDSCHPPYSSTEATPAASALSVVEERLAAREPITSEEVEPLVAAPTSAVEVEAASETPALLDAELAGFALRPGESPARPTPIPGMDEMLAIAATDDAVPALESGVGSSDQAIAAPYVVALSSSSGALTTVASVEEQGSGERELSDLVQRSEAQAHVLATLEMVARRVRGGEIVPSVDANATQEAVLASVLASILSSRT